MWRRIAASRQVKYVETRKWRKRRDNESSDINPVSFVYVKLRTANLTFFKSFFEYIMAYFSNCICFAADLSVFVHVFSNVSTMHTYCLIGKDAHISFSISILLGLLSLF